MSRGEVVRGIVQALSPPLLAKKGELLDFVFCYRILLGRHPSPAEVGLLEWKSENYTFAQFLEELCASEEFRKQPGYLPPGHHLMAELDGFRFWFRTADREMGQRMALGLYENEEVTLIKNIVRPGMTCWDIGAQTGFYSCLMASLVGDSGTVHAFEPMPENYKLLEKNILENDFEGRILPRNVACINSSGLLRMASYSGMLVATQLGGDNEVQCIRVDDLDLVAPDFVKIDVEGHEPAVLSGMSECLNAFNPTILLALNNYWLRECSDTIGATVIHWLESLGYHCLSLDGLLVKPDALANSAADSLECFNVICKKRTMATSGSY